MPYMPEIVKNRAWLKARILERKTVLTVGLDTDIHRLPRVVHGDVLAFNKSIIDATRDQCVAYKPNFAFYESMGVEGWNILSKTIEYIGHDHLIIADAKRGDIGNTSAMYARAVFDDLHCDAITVNPYMGSDCVSPFYRDEKWVIILALTSNTGSQDFQKLQLPDGSPLYRTVMETATAWGHDGNTMFVLGATHPIEVEACRAAFPRHFFLIPGIGAQGGDLDAICAAGLNEDGGLLINASRSILYASRDADFAEKANHEAEALNAVIRPHLLKAMFV